MLVNDNSTVSRWKHTYYVGMASAALLIVLWGFAPTYYLKSLIHPAPAAQTNAATHTVSTLVHIHAMLFTAWILLFAAQAVLVAAGRTHVHRRLGIAVGVLTGLMAVIGYRTAIQGGRDGWNPGGPFPDSLSFMAVSLFDLLLFSIFVGAGMYYRRRAELHKRLMLLGTLGGLMWPAITRMHYIAPQPLLMFGVLAMLVLAVPARDLWTNRRIHPVSLWGSFLILASFPLRSAIAMTGTWHRFAEWLVR